MTIQLLAFFAILFLLLLLMSLRRRRSMENVLRSTFSHYRFDEESNQLSLFTNHQATPDRSFSLETIHQYQIILNEKIIFSFVNDQSQYFSHHIVTQLKQHFANESRHKMVEHRIRKVHLVITIIQKKKYTICLYLRKGNQRYTKKHFNQVLDDIVSWCWLVANPKKDHSTIPSTEALIIDNDNATAKDLAQLAEMEEKSSQRNNDSHLIDQLDKLIRLKQQGHLSEEEFNLAKAKLLNELNSN